MNNVLSDSNVRADLEALREDLANLRQDVRSLATDAFGAARGGMTDSMDSLRERGGEIFESLEERVKEHPMATLGIAVGVGLIVGAIMLRR